MLHIDDSNDEVQADSERASHGKQTDPKVYDLRDTNSATRGSASPAKQVKPTRRSTRLSRKPAGNSHSLAAQDVEGGYIDTSVLLLGAMLPRTI